MNEIESFNQAKNRLKEFSEKTEAECEIEKVETEGGIFGWFDHKVTGEELNRILVTIQKHFMTVNSTNIELINEFREVYNALDALDNGYIKLFKHNFEVIAKTSDDLKVQQGILKQHNEKLLNQQSKLDEQQVEIEKTVSNISKIVTALKVFKEKFEGYKHLTDIDKIWNDINEAKESFNTIENSLQNIDADILKMQKHTDEIDSFIAILNDYTHLQDIDNMWDDLDIVKENIRKINAVIIENRENIQMHQNELDTLTTINAEHKEYIDTLFKKLADADEYAVNSRNFITELESFRTKVSALNHLMEVDEIWKQTESHQLRIIRVEQEGKSHTDKMNELVQAGDRMLESIDTNTHDINSLKKYKDKLGGISHLDDVDSIWKDVEGHTSQLIEGEKRDGEIAATIQKNKDEVDKNIADAVQTVNDAVESLTKKVKYAYWIAGCSVGLAIIELILLLMKVI